MPTRVLLVDDKEGVLELLSTILAAYEITTASDGAAALALLAEQPFDVVVSDIRMPGADGFEVLRAAKERAGGPEVVLMTAFAAVPDAVRAMRQGAYDYLAKPFDPDDVALVIARAVEHRTRRAEALAPAAEAPNTASVPYREAVESARDRASRDYLVALMRDFDGHVSAAAERAGMERVSLHRLLRRYGIRSDQFKRAR